MKRLAILSAGSTLGLFLVWTVPGLAQGEPSATPEPPAQPTPAAPAAPTEPAAAPAEAAAAPAEAAPAEGTEQAAPEQPLTEEQEFAQTGELRGDLQEDVDDALAGGSTVEKPGKTYYFVGARGRMLVIPQFMMNLFAQGGDTVVSYGVGPEFAVRKDGFEYNFSIWFADYGLSDTWFRGNNDPVTATEIVHADTKLLFLSADFMWSSEFTPEFALTYGAGLGIAPVFGDVIRTEAYPDPAPPNFSACRGVGDPDDVYCGDSDKYNLSEPGLTDGGSKPPIFLWVTGQAGLRYKFHRNFVTRFNAGFGTSGFFFGIGADYGI